MLATSETLQPSQPYNRETASILPCIMGFSLGFKNGFKSFKVSLVSKVSLLLLLKEWLLEGEMMTFVDVSAEAGEAVSCNKRAVIGHKEGS